MLKLNCVKHPSVSAEKGTQLDSNSCSVRYRDNLEVRSSVIRCGFIPYVLWCYKGWWPPSFCLCYYGFHLFNLYTKMVKKETGTAPENGDKHYGIQT